jgi:hypothetical protein
MTMDALVAWLESTRVAAAMTGYPLLWPMCEALHFMGLALLFGVTGLLDLRLTGLIRGVAVSSLQRLMPWAVAGFVINAVTGALFFIGTPSQYANNLAFWLKMLCIAIAGLNVLLFYASGLAARVNALDSGEAPPPGARIVGAVSLLLWLGVMYWGRMLPFLGDAF